MVPTGAGRPAGAARLHGRLRACIAVRVGFSGGVLL